MNRWVAALILVLLACVPIILAADLTPSVFDDGDTKAILASIRERKAPLSWFSGDWPLRNHFYRPVSTLSFEADNFFYGSKPAGYGITNVAIICSAVLALFWFAGELTRKAWFAAGCAILFAAWIRGPDFYQWVSLGGWAVGALAMLGIMYPGRRVLPGLLGLLISVQFVVEAGGVQDISSQVIRWLPSRTATLMTVFCLLSMAAYARYLRLASLRLPQPPSPLDRPATKSSQQETAGAGGGAWLALATVCALLALGSYEQAMMLPFALLGVAVFFRLRGYLVPWRTLGWFAGVLGVYLLARLGFVPTEASGYQRQQLHNTVNALSAAFDPALHYGQPLLLSLRTLQTGSFAAYLGDVYTLGGPLVFCVANVVAYWNILGGYWRNRRAGGGVGEWESGRMGERGGDRIRQDMPSADGGGPRNLSPLPPSPPPERKRGGAEARAPRDPAAEQVRLVAIAGWVLFFVAFLPMSVLKPFPHYSFWPMAMRAVFAAALFQVAVEAMVSAASRPVLQAPRRLDPAPGSLPRP